MCNLRNLWDEIISTKKNLRISVKSVGRNNPPQRKICVYLRNLWDKIIPTKKNLRHLRNLRDKKQQEHISGASHWPAAKVPRNSVSNPISKNASDSSVKSDEKNEETKK